MNSRMTTGRGGYEPGRISRYSVFWLTKAKTQSFLAALEVRELLEAADPAAG